MITSHDFDCAGYARDLRERGLEATLNNIDTLLGVADEGKRWSDEFLRQVEERAKKAYLRRLLRVGFVDEETGERITALSIEETDPETGEIRKGYKQLRFFTVDDFEWAIRDTKRRIGAENRKLRILCRLAYARFGEEIQLRFDFQLPLGKKCTASN
jgi:hypothetical protein